MPYPCPPWARLDPWDFPECQTPIYRPYPIYPPFGPFFPPRRPFGGPRDGRYGRDHRRY